MTPEWTGFENSLKSLFTHEMTHAVSLGTRGSFLKGLHKVFGGWVYPAALTAPLFMVEGVTVSFESLDGFGRANDPLIKEGLRQAIYEDRFLTPFQAAGVYDLPPAKSAHYYYGGLFSAYLQQSYGMEKYAELWQAMGRRYHFSLFFYNNGYFNLFEKVYGIPFLEAWENFRADLALDGIEDNSGGILRGGKSLITGIAAGEDKVFALDRLAYKVIAYDPASGKSETPVSVDSSGYALAASGDGKNLLVSSYRYVETRAQAVVTEYFAKGGKTGRVWQDLYGGSYFRDGAIGLSSSGHINNLVFRKGAGKPGPETEELLLRGSAELIYSHPQAVNDTWIAFIALKQGKRHLNLYNYETKRVYRLGSALKDDELRWRYIRSLNKSEGYLLFGYNHDDRMYKLGVVDVRALAGETPPEPLEAVFTEQDFSGGVFLPVTVRDEIYYRGAFATWDALMKYPEGMGSLSGVRAPLSLIPWEEEELAVAEPDRPPRLPPLSGAESKSYLPFKYFNPLRLWFPIPYVRSTGDFFSLDGGGVFSFMADPADINWIILSANMDARFYMANLDIQWINLSFGFPLNLRFIDRVDMYSQNNYRTTHGTLVGTLNRSIGNERHRFILTAGAGFTLTASDPRNGAGAYTWNYRDSFFNGLAGLQFSNLRRFSWEHFGQGLSAAYTSRFVFSGFLFRHEAVLKAAFEPYLPLQLTLYGVLDKNGMTLHGSSPNFTVTSISNVASLEYPTGGIQSLTWLGGGEAELKFFSLNVQDNFSHLYFNRLFGTLAYRGAFYDGSNIAHPQGNLIGDRYRLTQSLILRFGGDVSVIPLTAMPVRLSPYMWGGWKISTLDDNIFANNFVFGFNVSLEL
jgi:hypothetical protein